MQDTAAVVVLYYPKPDKMQTLLASVCLEVGRVIIVDNTPDSTLVLDDINVEVIRFGKNLGVGAAQNIGIRKADELGFTHVLLLDQDSELGVAMVRNLRHALNEGERITGGRMACVGPQLVDRDTAHRAYFAEVVSTGLRRHFCSDEELVSASYLIASGSLYRISVFGHVGYFDESLFIDYVDTDWCFRAADRGYTIFGVCSALLFHRLGLRTVRVQWWREFNVPLHSAVRYYYMCRNFIALTKRGYVPFPWKIAESVRLARLFFFAIVRGPQRVKILENILRGFAAVPIKGNDIK